MNNYVELENEYQAFMLKLTKLGKDLNDEINNLSPENFKRFKSEIKNILPASFLQLSKLVND